MAKSLPIQTESQLNHVLVCLVNVKVCFNDLGTLKYTQLYVHVLVKSVSGALTYW